MGRRLGMAAPKTNADARRFRQRDGLPFEMIFFIQHEKNAVIPAKVFLAQMLGGDAHPHLAEKDQGLRAGLLQASDRGFHIQKMMNLQRSFHPDQAAGRQGYLLRHIQNGGLRILQLAQAMIDLALDPL